MAIAGPELALEHLKAELARIDALLRRQVRGWQLAGQDPADSFRGLYVSDAQADALLSRPLGAHWGHACALPPQEANALALAEKQARQQAQAIAEAARCQGKTVPLKHLAAVFHLEPFDIDALLIALAPCVDLRYERLYGYLQDDVTHKWPGVNLVLDLLCPAGLERLQRLSHFGEDAPLIKHHLLTLKSPVEGNALPLLAQTLVPDEGVVAWLLGCYRPGGDLAHHAHISWPDGDEGMPPLEADLCAALEKAMVRRTLVAFHGPDDALQRAAAGWLARRTARPLLRVNLASILENEQPIWRILRLALRDARLLNAIPYFEGWDACLHEGTPSASTLAELCAYPDLVILASEAPWQPKGIERRREFVWLPFEVPGFIQRHALWRYFLAQQAPDTTLSKPEVEPLKGLDLEVVADQFALTAGQIRDAAATAWDRAAQRGNSLNTEDLLAAARAHSAPRLSALARKIAPRYSWADIVLPEDQLALLHEIVATVRGRPQVLDAWGLGHKLVSSRGVTALFSGPPGTGKTMAAEIIAGELGLDLYKIDLSTVVSKYIGETEKNLERIFVEAESSNAILFFDEADALFGKRSEVRDAHDRYANIEVGYLLQRMEAYDGITILATNLRANLDEAFTRRLQFAVDFPFPDEADRLRIWHTLFPPDVPRGQDVDLELLARRFKLAGGSIRNILVTSAYLAADDGRCLTMEHLLRATRRELHKLGRLVADDEFCL
ncbi:MAG: ATP-binding protein [Chloroflexi bacterium]|nr:ATP-binding protein [Chloroflexota bacterium]